MTYHVDTLEAVIDNKGTSACGRLVNEKTLIPLIEGNELEDAMRDGKKICFHCVPKWATIRTRVTQS